MKKVLLVNPNNNKKDYKPNKIYEPTNLLGIYNILKSRYNCLFIDAIKERFNFSDINSIIVKYNPNYLLLSVYDVNEIIEFNYNIIKFIKKFNSSCQIVVGGPGAIHSTKKIIDKLSPDYLIVGEGEDYYQKFVSIDSLDCMPYKIINNTKVIKTSPLECLDSINYERDYSFEDYDFMAMPNIQRGCIGHCIYCTGCGYTKIRYRCSKNVVDEIEYLKNDCRVKKIMPLGPDFTVIPKKALEIIQEINNRNIVNLEYIFVTRLDTLYNSINLNPQEWEKFFLQNKVSFQIGIESFQSNKLIRLKKYFKENYFSNNQYEIVENLIKKYNILINGYFILIDPLSNKLEINNDINSIIHLLEEYSTKFTITGKLINYLEFYDDTVAKHLYENYNLSQYIKDLIKKADEINSMSLYSKRLLEDENDLIDRSNEQILVLKKFQNYSNNL